MADKPNPIIVVRVITYRCRDAETYLEDRQRWTSECHSARMDMASVVLVEEVDGHG